jgi:hypothetical protein
MNSKECEKAGCITYCKWYQNEECNHPDRVFDLPLPEVDILEWRTSETSPYIRKMYRKSPFEPKVPEVP